MMWYRLHCNEVELYGGDVISAYGEYCGYQKRILARKPHLMKSLHIVSRMIVFLMRAR